MQEGEEVRAITHIRDVTKDENWEALDSATRKLMLIFAK
jgi:hypothetical protein